MAKIFRLWEKKRGERRTGSKLVGGVGEALFFGILFLIGLVLLVALIASQAVNPQPEMYQLGFGFWLLVIVLASFILIGGGGLIWTVLQVGTSAERRAALANRAANLDLIHEALPRAEFPTVPGDANLTNSPGTTLAYRLPTAEPTAWRLLAAATFCLVWNMIAAVLVGLTLKSLRSDRPEWFLAIFVVPFLATGIWAIFYFLRQMTFHTGIGPTQLEVSEHPLVPGQACRFFLSQSGRMTLDLLEVSLVCDEQATFLQGTDIRTETHTVVRQELYRREGCRVDGRSPLEYEGEFAVPATAMHSFHGDHNTVQWKLVVRGTADAWPEFERGFPLVVYPDLPAKTTEPFDSEGVGTEVSRENAVDRPSTRAKMQRPATASRTADTSGKGV